MISINNNKMLGFELLNSFPGICHFVTTRKGGCSKGNYASLNCSPYSGDDLANVKENQQRLYADLAVKNFEWVVPFQTHGSRIGMINSVYQQANANVRQSMLDGIDALITHLPDFCLCISTADCIPVLIYDSVNKVIAAVHAGWRGTVTGIVSGTIRALEEKYGTHAADLVVGIGPGISMECFEVGEEVYETFTASGADMDKISYKDQITGKWHIDLPKANYLQLIAKGVKQKNIEMAGICTYKNVEQFFSARRLGIHSGRIWSGIMLKTTD